MKPFGHLIDQALEEKAERLKQSEERLKQYLKTRDPQIVIDYFSFSPYAIKDKASIAGVIDKWRREGEYDLLRRIFSRPPGVKKAANDDLKLNGVMAVQVDTLTSQGLSKEEAFERLTTLGDVNRDKETCEKSIL